MKKEVEISILKRILENINSRTLSDNNGYTEFFKLPIEKFTSKEIFTKEQNTLFKEFPLVVGFSSEIPNPGDYIAHDLTNTPIIVIRNKDMSLKAYINACRHRGARILDDAKGNCKGLLKCPFHGWSYSPKNGDLKGLSNPEGFPCIDKKEFGLIPLPVEECLGMVFVIPTPGKEIDVQKYLGDIYHELKSLGYDKRVTYKSNLHPRKMNWKFGVEANSESYHFPFLHKESTADGFLSYGTVADYIKPHGRFVVPQKRILKEFDKDENEWNLAGNTTTIYFIFPGTFYLTGKGYGHVLSILPQSEKHCTFISGYLVDDLLFTEENKKLWDKQHDYYWKALYEDMNIGESVQTTLNSGANTHFALGTYEFMINRFHETVQEVIDGKFSLEDISNPTPEREIEKIEKL